MNCGSETLGNYPSSISGKISYKHQEGDLKNENFGGGGKSGIRAKGNMTTCKICQVHPLGTLGTVSKNVKKN